MAIHDRNGSALAIRASLKQSDERTKAPGFVLKGASGYAIRLSDHRGKVVAINLWATDCGGCRREIPSFVKIDETYRSKGLAVVGVSMDISYEGLKNAQQAWSRVKPFVHAHGMHYMILMGDRAVARRTR